MGFFVTLMAPTGPMAKEAVKAGYYHSKLKNENYPKLQILTIEGLMSGTERPRYFDLSKGGQSFKRAKVEQQEKEQLGFFQ